MKKIILLLIFILTFTFSFAADNNSKEKTQQKTNEKEKIVTSEKEKNTLCTATCSTTYNNITYTFKAGNFLSSCERAERRCAEKMSQVFAVE